MSEAVTILTAIKTQLSDYADLSAVKSWNINESEIDLEGKGKFPWVNIKANSLKIVAADNLRLYDAERHLYDIQITFAVRTSSKSLALSDIWDLYEDINSGLKSDLSLSGNVSTAPFIPDLQVDGAFHESGKFWIGGASLVYQVYKDLNKR